MFETQKRAFSDLMDSVMPIYAIEASKPTKQIWWNLLVGYEFNDVGAAFAEYLRTGKFAPKPADIIALIDKMRPDGRPGADEAWAMIPRDEHSSVVWTEEMAEAFGIAKSLLGEGDQVAARRSFIEAYNRIVETNKRNGIVPKWFPSLGSDKEGLAHVLAEAVRLGRLGAKHAIGLLPPDNVAPMLEMAGEKTLAIEHNLVTNEQAKINIEKIKTMMLTLKQSNRFEV